MATGLPASNARWHPRKAAGPLKRSADCFGNRIRIVAIGDYDRGPCIGPLVASTDAVGAFRITTTRQQDGILRIRFKRQR